MTQIHAMFRDMMKANSAAPFTGAPSWTEEKVEAAALALIKCEAGMHHGDPASEDAFEDLAADLKFTISNNMLLTTGTIVLRECAKLFDLAILAAHEATDQQYCY